MYTLTCAACDYMAPFELTALGTAEHAAELHQMLGPEHRVTCRRPARYRIGGVPIVVFETRLTFREPGVLGVRVRHGLREEAK